MSSWISALASGTTDIIPLLPNSKYSAASALPTTELFDVCLLSVCHRDDGRRCINLATVQLPLVLARLVLPRCLLNGSSYWIPRPCNFQKRPGLQLLLGQLMALSCQRGEGLCSRDCVGEAM